MDYKTYEERLNLVNKDHKTRSVWTAIDKPMRPLIYQLHRIGVMTKFSCCGFPYIDEENDEPKTHCNKAYVQIVDPNKYGNISTAMKDACIKNFNIIKDHVNTTFEGTKQGWKMFYFQNDIWEICCTNWMPDFYSKDDGLELSIHDYEPFVISIYALTKFIEQMETVIPDLYIRVTDGNSYYKELEHWAVKPKCTGSVDDAEDFDKSLILDEKRK